jgi:HSP20 family protein
VQSIRKIHLMSFQRVGDQFSYEMTQLKLTTSQGSGDWRPSVNAYRCRECFVICMELAGVERSSIVVRVEPRRLTISGQRPAPEPCEDEGPQVQVLALEIDFGRFERELVLPREVIPGKVRAEQRNGLLWIYLPLASPG